MHENIHGTNRVYHRQLVEILVVGIWYPGSGWLLLVLDLVIVQRKINRPMWGCFKIREEFGLTSNSFVLLCYITRKGKNKIKGKPEKKKIETHYPVARSSLSASRRLLLLGKGNSVVRSLLDNRLIFSYSILLSSCVLFLLFQISSLVSISRLSVSLLLVLIHENLCPKLNPHPMIFSDELGKQVTGISLVEKYEYKDYRRRGIGAGCATNKMC